MYRKIFLWAGVLLLVGSVGFVGGSTISRVQTRGEMKCALKQATAVAQAPSWDCPPEGFNIWSTGREPQAFLSCRELHNEWRVRVYWVLLKPSTGEPRGVDPSELPMIARFHMDPETREVSFSEVRWSLWTQFVEEPPLDDA